MKAETGWVVITGRATSKGEHIFNHCEVSTYDRRKLCWYHKVFVLKGQALEAIQELGLVGARVKRCRIEVK